MIEAEGVCLNYPDGTMALRNVDLHIEPGEMIYITGPSGSGKTSLLKLFIGIEFPTDGKLTVLGQPIIRGQASKIRQMRRSIGPVFQDFRLVNGRTAIENVMLGARFLDMSNKKLKENAVIALKKVGLEKKMFSMVEHLSWGQCQRVAIARAIVRKPRLIIADEPTGNLDKDNAINIMELFASLKEENTTVVITTHATHLINNLREGRLIHIESGIIHQERLD
ncbi:cell division ATP-binding protein FtsE [Lutispora thermophila]|uniref:Cell division transport system ATP-binding protein n=1 Tax=Lutispora thermophila DSM 19022 TaxID=1122184 RepID=A0A1M6D818_9FIRM|nr:ATP-binding cassette domain-containing protein [Lutispora thermophila]SHI69301.1 cell division transport system ATP-binding protein [Lutispora thermophila DSM 19022]